MIMLSIFYHSVALLYTHSVKGIPKKQKKKDKVSKQKRKKKEEKSFFNVLSFSVSPVVVLFLGVRVPFSLFRGSFLFSVALFFAIHGF